MKVLITIAFVFVLSFNVMGQQIRINNLIREGAELFEQEKYYDAIEKYKIALELDKKNTTAKYELAYTFMTIDMYGEAIRLSKEIIRQNKDNVHEAYLVMGISLEMSGKTNEAINVFENGINKFPSSYLLHYNIALSNYNIKEYDKAEKAIVKAININPRHSASHLLISNIMKNKGENIKSNLALYNYLLLEPTTKRSMSSIKALRNYINKTDNKNTGNNTTNNNSDNDKKNNAFISVESTMNNFAAMRTSDKYKDIDDNKFFVEYNTKLFAELAIEIKDTNDWWHINYIKKFSDMNKTGNTEAFSYYILQSLKTVEVNSWIKANTDKINKLKIWIKKQ